jgi:UDP-glucose 4-epimerase
LSGRHGRPAAITLFSRDEFKQFHMRTALERDHVDACPLHFRLGDIRDLQSVKLAMRPADVVFHAAALKQVPQCEYNPVEAVQTNVMGAANLARAASELGVEAVIAASTDKACHPTNVMGMTKALQERVLIAANLDSPGKRFMCARYGNVLGSRGSVFDTFRGQIERGIAVTLTRRDMTRFVVTLDDAMDAMISIYRFGRAGEIFVPRAAGVHIATLAESLIGDRTIPMIETGVRPGEKIHEVLISQDEISRTSERHGYYVLAPMLEELGHGKPATLKTPFCSNDRLLDRAALDRLLRRHGLSEGSGQNHPSRRAATAEELARAQA